MRCTPATDVYLMSVCLAGCVSSKRVSHNICISGIYIIDVSLSRAFLEGVHPIDIHLIGVHLLGIHLLGVCFFYRRASLTGVYLYRCILLQSCISYKHASYRRASLISMHLIDVHLL
jgi:hypothetical protein